MNLTLSHPCHQSNVLEQVELRGVAGSVRFLDLSENRLTSVQGLSHCHHLLELDLSGNRITRFGTLILACKQCIPFLHLSPHSLHTPPPGGLGGCWRLQHLSIDSNLVVGCEGLEGLPYLQYFSCAENHLPCVNGLQHCHLLSTVCMQQNNLQEVWLKYMDTMPYMYVHYTCMCKGRMVFNNWRKIYNHTHLEGNWECVHTCTYSGIGMYMYMYKHTWCIHCLHHTCTCIHVVMYITFSSGTFSPSPCSPPRAEAGGEQPNLHILHLSLLVAPSSDTFFVWKLVRVPSSLACSVFMLSV